MSKEAEGYRNAMKEKARRLTREDPKGGKKKKIDASGYEVPDELMAEVKTGMRPISQRQYKSGGAVSGATALKNGGRATRAHGGKLATGPLNNTDMKKLNEERVGEKHVGGFNKGGRAKRNFGGGFDPVAAAQSGMAGSLAGSQVPPPTRFNFSSNPSPVIRKHGGKAMPPGDTMVTGTRPTGGRIAKADGGRAKGKTNINIIIAQSPPHGAGLGGPPGGPGPVKPPAPPTMGAPPPGMPPGMAGMAPPPGMPPQQALGRRDGGRTLAKMRYGSGGGEGRLEKIKKYGD